MLTYGAIAKRYRPEWLVWENVPGVLSSNRGRDFGTFLGMLAELGYGFAYRVLDAQYFGVAQRRRRVFVVGHLGNWQRAAAVLFERHSLQGHPAPSREKGKDIAGTIAARFGNSRNNHEECVAQTLLARRGGADFETETLTVAFDWQSGGDVRGLNPKDTAQLQRSQVPAVAQPTYGIPGNWIGRQPENGGNAVEPMHDVSPCLTKTDRHGVAAMQVRRLTPVECERLQGFPDNYTRIPWKLGYWAADKHSPEVLETIAKQCPDGPRYKALGNSMAVPVMRWIGERVAAVEAL
jgi:DNA (cytosine-5)-methyltransferase 1